MTTATLDIIYCHENSREYLAGKSIIYFPSSFLFFTTSHVLYIIVWPSLQPSHNKRVHYIFSLPGCHHTHIGKTACRYGGKVVAFFHMFNFSQCPELGRRILSCRNNMLYIKYSFAFILIHPLNGLEQWGGMLSPAMPTTTFSFPSIIFAYARHI